MPKIQTIMPLSLNKMLLQEICDAYRFGENLSSPKLCPGGRMHDNYLLNTEKGRYILKLFDYKNDLNLLFDANKKVFIEKRIRQYRQAETIANYFAKKINAIAAIENNRNDVIFQKDDFIVCVYPYVAAHSLAVSDLQKRHAKCIGTMLAQMHSHQPVDLSAAPVDIPVLAQCIEHVSAAKHIKFIHDDTMLLANLNQFLILLNELQHSINEDTACLSQQTVVSHRDCDHHNVLWDQQQNYYIIDWELAGLNNRTKDVLVTAIYWSLSQDYIVQIELLKTFVSAYQQHALTLQKNEIECAFRGFIYDWINWIDINLVRIIESAKKDIVFLSGIKEIKKTAHALPILLAQCKKIITCFF